MPELAVDFVRSAIIIFLLLTGMAYMTWFERRAVRKLQGRIGPNPVGTAGLLQPLADALKLFFKEDIAPGTADRPLYFLAPAIALFAALAAFAVMPLGPLVYIGGVPIALQVAELQVSLLYLIGVSSIGI